MTKRSPTEFGPRIEEVAQLGQAEGDGGVGPDGHAHDASRVTVGRRWVCPGS